MKRELMDADGTYRRFAQYYDLYVGDFCADLTLYKSFCSANDRILEVGCGAGRVLQSFLQDGFAITGVDISPEMLDLARKKLLDFCQQGSLRLFQHDFRNKPLLQRYKRVLVTFYTFNYILEDPGAFLQNLCQSMTEDALLIMDLFYPKTLANPELDNIWTMHEFGRHGRTISLRDKRRLVNNIEERIQIYKEHGEPIEIVTTRRYYPPDEISHILQMVGFREVQFVQGYESSDFQPNINPEQFGQNFLVKAVREF
jgi:SAM-dependent methyltransferase